MALSNMRRTVVALAASSGVLISLGALPPAAVAQQARPAAAKTAAAKPAAAKAAPRAATTTTRAGVPAKAAQDKALKYVKTAFAAQYAKVAPADKAALAATLLQRGGKAGAGDDDATRYVMLQQAGELAAAGGDLRTAFAAADALAARFKGVNPITLKLDSLAATGSAKLPADPARPKALVDGYLMVSAEALRAGELDQALKIISAPAPTALAARDPALAKQLAVRKKELGDLLAQYGDAVAAAREKLRTSPGDLAANGTLGKFYCLVAGNWPKGVRMLAAGKDKVLRKLAQDDLLGTQLSASGRARVGDAWWDLGEKEPGVVQRNARARAAHWYKLALRDMRGLQRGRLEERVALVEPDAKIPAALPGTGAVAVVPPPDAPAAPARGPKPVGGNPANTKRVVDLMALLDPARDLLNGTGSWMMGTDGLLTTAESRDALILPYRPPDEYDFVIEFTRLSGQQAISQLVVKPGARQLIETDLGFEWFMGGSASPASGFRAIAVVEPSPNPPGWKADPAVENGKRHKAVIEVRKDRVRALVDEQLVSEWAGDYASVSNPYNAEIAPVQKGAFLNRLGLRTWDTAVAFHQVYVVEVTGTGEAMRKPMRPSKRRGGEMAFNGSPGAGNQPPVRGPGDPKPDVSEEGSTGAGRADNPPATEGGAGSQGAAPSGPTSPDPVPGAIPGTGGGGPGSSMPPGGMPPGYGTPPPGSGPPSMPGMPPGYGKPPPGAGQPGMPGMPPGYGKPPPGAGPPVIDMPSMPGYPNPPPGGGPPPGPGMPPGAGPGNPPSGGPGGGMPPGAGPGKPPGGGGPSGGMPPGAGPGNPPSGGPGGGGMPPGAGPGKPPGGGGPTGGMPPGAGPGKPPGGGGPTGGMPPGAGPGKPPGGGGPTGGMPPGAGPTKPPGPGGPTGGMPPGAGPTKPPGPGGPTGGMPPGAGPTKPPGPGGPTGGMPPGAGPTKPPAGGGPTGGMPPGAGPGKPPGGGPTGGMPPGSGPGAPPTGGGPTGGMPPGSGSGGPPSGGGPTGGMPPGSGPGSPPSGGGAPPSGTTGK
jgi:hypothetical protein